MSPDYLLDRVYTATIRAARQISTRGGISPQESRFQRRSARMVFLKLRGMLQSRVHRR